MYERRWGGQKVVWLARRVNGTRVNFSWSRFGVAESEVRILPRDTQIVAAYISEIVGADRRALCFEGGATACSTR